MQLIVEPEGGLRCIYGEAIDLTAIGRVEIALRQSRRTHRCGSVACRPASGGRTVSWTL